MRTSLLSVSFVLSFAIAVGQTNAQDPRATAQALFDDGLRLMDQKAYDRACPKIEEAVRLQPGKVGGLLQLGACYEGAGKLVSALGRYQDAASTARTTNDPRGKAAQDKIAELQPKLPHLTIVVPDEVRRMKGLVIKRDELEVGAAQWDGAAVDAGKHSIVASAPGKKAWTGTVAVVGSAAASIAVPILDEDAPPPVASASAMPPDTSPSAPAVAAPISQPLVADARGGAPAYAFVLGGVGLVAGGIAIGLAVSSSASQSDINQNCGKNLPGYLGPDCTAKGSSNNTKQLAAGILGGVGAVALGVAIVTIIRAPRRAPPSGSAAIAMRMTPWFAPTGGGASLMGGF